MSANSVGNDADKGPDMVVKPRDRRTSVKFVEPLTPVAKRASRTAGSKKGRGKGRAGSLSTTRRESTSAGATSGGSGGAGGGSLMSTSVTQRRLSYRPGVTTGGVSSPGSRRVSTDHEVKAYKKRIYEELIKRRNALDLGRPIKVTTLKATDEDEGGGGTDEDVATTDSSEKETGSTDDNVMEAGKGEDDNEGENDVIISASGSATDAEVTTTIDRDAQEEEADYKGHVTISDKYLDEPDNLSVCSDTTSELTRRSDVTDTSRTDTETDDVAPLHRRVSSLSSSPKINGSLGEPMPFYRGRRNSSLPSLRVTEDGGISGIKVSVRDLSPPEEYGVDSHNSIRLDAAENAMLLGHSKSTGAIIHQLSSRMSRVVAIKTLGRNRRGAPNELLPEIPSTSTEEDLQRIQRATGHNLTYEQVKAFREVFDLFDQNGGGTIDSAELNTTLRSVGISIPPEDLRDVMLTLDADGNGVIDFAEFLKLMTSTERFLEALTNCSVRENLLFEALTEFMKKSALNGMSEIREYYHNKYRKVQVAVPHVVNHYAAGARLIGLTENQIKQHIARLKADNIQQGSGNSPYAHPLNIIGLTSNKSFKRRERRRRSSPEEPRLHDRERRYSSIRGKIMLVVKVSQQDDQGQDKSKANKPRPGWLSQRTEHVSVKLPASHLCHCLPFDEVCADDTHRIREHVTRAIQEHLKQRRMANVHRGIQHWKDLNVRKITPQVLRDHFRIIFSHYSHVSTSKLPLPETQ